mgnify:CR=1 FL=1
MALEECASCFCSPNSHTDVIHSIILCFSDAEPYLNFLSIEEIEEIRKKIADGASINIKSEVFNRAEEAYSAVKLNRGPKVIQYFSTISFPIIAVVLLTILATIFI